MMWRNGKCLIINLLSLVLLLASCQETPSFTELAQQFSVDYERQFAREESEVLTIFTPQKVSADLEFCNKYLALFTEVQEGDFPFGERQNLADLTGQLKEKRQRISSYQSFPDRYDVRRPIERILAAEGQTLEEKLRVVEQQLSLTERYYAAAKSNLQKVQPEAAKNAVRLHQQTYRLLDRELPDLVAQTSWNNIEQQQFLRYAENAKLAVKDYIGYCRSLSRMPT